MMKRTPSVILALGAAVALAFVGTTAANAVNTWYYSGHTSVAQMKMSGTAYIKGGTTAVVSTAATAVNGTYVSGHLTDQAVGTGTTSFTHTPRSGARNGCYWTMSPPPSSLSMDCYYDSV